MQGVAAGRIASHREDPDYMRVFASNPSVVGMPLGGLRFPDGAELRGCACAAAIRICCPRRSFVLEAGDRVGLLGNRAHQVAVRAFFGDSIKSTADLEFHFLGHRRGCGLLVGAIPLRFRVSVRSVWVWRRCCWSRCAWQGAPQRTVRMDDAAFREPCPSQPRTHHLPRASGHRLRTQVRHDRRDRGAAAAALWRDNFARARRRHGDVLPLWALQAVFRYIGGRDLRCNRQPRDSRLRELRVAPTDQPDIMYAMIFPSMTILKVLFVQLAIAIAAG